MDGMSLVYILTFDIIKEHELGDVVTVVNHITFLCAGRDTDVQFF